MPLNPTVLREGRDAVRAVRRQGRLLLAAALTAYVWLVSVVGRRWPDIAFFVALALVPVFGVLGVMVTTKLARAKGRQLGLVCPRCAAPIVDERGRVTLQEQQCGACGEVVLSQTDDAVPTTRQLPTRQEFNRRVDEWRAQRGDNWDTVKLVGAPCAVVVGFIVFVVGGFGTPPPDWATAVAGVCFTVPLIVYFVLKTRLRHLADRLQLGCECGVLLAEPEGPSGSRDVKAAVKDLEEMRRGGTCWYCGRRVWQGETTS